MNTGSAIMSGHFLRDSPPAGEKTRTGCEDKPMTNAWSGDDSRGAGQQSGSNPQQGPTTAAGTGHTGQGSLQTLSQGEVVQLLMAHRGMLLGYICTIVGDRHLGEDVFQEMSMVVVDKHEQLRDAEGFPRWARTIARYKSLQALARRRQTNTWTDDLLDRFDAAWDQETGPSEDSAAITALRSCLAALSPYSRRIIQLRYQEGMEGVRIAATLAKPANTIHVALSRIHRALHECICGRLRSEHGS